MQNPKGFYSSLITMFEQTEEQKSVNLDKKSLQKCEDAAEKADKNIDSYITKQLSTMYKKDDLKAKGYDQWSL